MADSKFWRKSSVRSEWEPLREVALFIPRPDTPAVEDVNSIQHLEPINFSLLHEQVSKLVECYEKFGVRVHLIRSVADFNGEPKHRYNLMFVRDLFFMTKEGAIISRMASIVRAGEEMHVAKTLAELAVPILRTISGAATFEAADAIWIHNGLVAIGVGNRTNDEGFRQVQQCLRSQGVKCVRINMPREIQHLFIRHPSNS